MEIFHGVFNTVEGYVKKYVKEKMESIDILKEETMKLSDKEFRKLRIGEVYFSPTLNNLGNIWELWKIVIKTKERKNINI